ncbi:BRCA1-associated RING domain protein 1-like [Pectinophora gossypiella]|uniref:BRCA1-associated RING domain protein 1-like n=1 Tax=Pectinophora gossypiella TaxID=13191 RepID=UPI00214ED6D5|nr:BRCA1-associated RING domain protein 1-like [Pectinophora gossypiella]
MTSTDMNNFLSALEAVKQDYTCKICFELCKNPVTLSKCFHLICSEHFEGLQYCPECNCDLEGCTTFFDDRLGPCIESAASLDQMFEKYKPTSKTGAKKGGKQKSSTKTETFVRKPDSLLDYPLKEDNANKKRAPSKKETTSDEKNFSKENKIVKHTKTDNKGRNDPNVSLISSASSRINKMAEKRNNKGETPLHIACRLGKIDKVTELLNQGANTNTKDNAGWTPLHEVVQNGRLDLVQVLLPYNTLINVPGPGNETPLHEAVRYGHVDIAVELVKNGADVHAKNCKGETPMQLATDDMKETLKDATENIVQTQSVNVTAISGLYSELDLDDVRIYCVSQYRTVLNKLKALVKHHSNLHLETKFTKKVTHLIVDAEDGVCQSSVDVLQGIVSSIWILSSDWINKSTEETLEPFDKYEIVGVGTKTYNGPKNSRYNKYKQYPGVFDGCHFYLHNFTVKYEVSKTMILTKAIVTKLITDAGGKVLRRAPNPELIPEAERLIPYHAKKDGKLTKCSHYIIFKDIYEPMYNMQHLKALPIGWLIECIEKYELCEPW